MIILETAEAVMFHLINPDSPDCSCFFILPLISWPIFIMKTSTNVDSTNLWNWKKPPRGLFCHTLRIIICQHFHSLPTHQAKPYSCTLVYYLHFLIFIYNKWRVRVALAAAHCLCRHLWEQFLHKENQAIKSADWCQSSTEQVKDFVTVVCKKINMHVTVFACCWHSLKD